MNGGKRTRVVGEVKSAPKDFETHLVFLDTQVFRRYHFNPYNKLLRIIAKLVDERKIDLFITDITLSEISRQIAEEHNDLSNNLRRSERDLNYWKQRAGIKSDDRDLNGEIRSLASDTYNNLVRCMRLTRRERVIRATEVNAAEIFVKYFSKAPPFEKPGSKEFPDAFVIESLNEWCITNNSQMNIVSGDQSFRNAADLTDNLISFETLDQLLESFAERENHDSLSYAMKFIGASIDMSELRAKLQDTIDENGLVYIGDLVDGEANEADIIADIEIDHYSLLSHGRHLSFIMTISATLNVDVSYDDMSFAMYDKEDDRNYGVEADSALVECKTSVDCYVKFEDATGKIADFELIDADVRVYDMSDVY